MRRDDPRGGLLLVLACAAGCAAVVSPGREHDAGAADARLADGAPAPRCREPSEWDPATARCLCFDRACAPREWCCRSIMSDSYFYQCERAPDGRTVFERNYVFCQVP